MITQTGWTAEGAGEIFCHISVGIISRTFLSVRGLIPPLAFTLLFCCTSEKEHNSEALLTNRWGQKLRWAYLWLKSHFSTVYAFCNSETYIKVSFSKFDYLRTSTESWEYIYPKQKGSCSKFCVSERETTFVYSTLYGNETDYQKQLDTPSKNRALILTESSVLFCFWCMNDLEVI